MRIQILLVILVSVLLISGCAEKETPQIPPGDRTNATLFNDSDFTSTETPMLFGITIDSVGYRFPDSYLGPIDLKNSKKEIDIANDLGADFVRFDIRNETLGYPGEVKKLDEIIDYARSKNLKVHIGVYGMETWLSSLLSMIVTAKEGGAGEADWTDFKEMYMWETDYLAKRYQPDYMMIMVECPFNIGNQVNSVRTTQEWVDYTRQVANRIKEVSPDTIIILGGTARIKSSPTSIEFIDAIMKEDVENIDIIGIHPYSYEELEDEVTSVNWLKQKYRWQGDIWIDETNTFPFKDEEYQKEYLEYAIYFAAENDIKGVCIFRMRDISDDVGGNYGFVNMDFTTKTAYQSVKESINKYK